MIRFLRPLVLLFALFVPFAAAQDGPATLTLLERIEGSLASGTSDSYVIDAEAEQFVAGAANQLSVDVIVKIFGPDDAKLEEFDGPAAGPEHFTFETKTAGQYRIEVAPFEEAAGDYTISLTVLEPIAKTGPGASINSWRPSAERRHRAVSSPSFTRVGCCSRRRTEWRT